MALAAAIFARARSVTAAGLLSTLAVFHAFAQEELAPAPGAASAILIRDDLVSGAVELVEITDRAIGYLDEGSGLQSLELGRCIGLFRPQSRAISRPEGVLELVDGQRFPGQAYSSPPADGALLAWNHAWLGRIEVPLDLVRSVRFRGPSVALTGGDEDRVLLANGDLLEGFIVALGDPLALEARAQEQEQRQIIEIPLDRVLAVEMVAADQPARGSRVWLHDGTVIDVNSIRVGEDGFVHLVSPWLEDRSDPELRIEQVAAILFRARGMVPLALLETGRIAGPLDRFRLPPPRRLDPEAPLGLSPIELRGPLIVHYPLPEGCRRFAAEAILPEADRNWGDLELLVKDDDQVVFRTQLNGQSPRASINVPVRGAELTIELTEGRYGPIQDRVQLERAMLLFADRP